MCIRDRGNSTKATVENMTIASADLASTIAELKASIASLSMRDVKKSSPAARGIGTFFGHQPPVTFSIHAEDSRISGEDILPPRAVQVPINSIAKRSKTPKPSTAVPIFLFLVAGAASREGPSSARTTSFFPAAVNSRSSVISRVTTVWQTV